MSLLATRNLSRRFGGLDAVRDVNLTLEPGRIRALICIGSNPVAAWPDQLKTVRAMEALDLVDLCRVDMRMDQQGNLYILEVNPLPLLLPDPEEASFVASSQAAGYDYDAMINRIITIACERLDLPIAETRRMPRLFTKASESQSKV